MTLSGLAALVYQVAWTRRLTLLFGASTYAVATVLAAFLGGLALGAWLLGPVLDRARRPLGAYAVLEAGVGLYALAFPLLLRVVEALYLGWARAVPGSLEARIAVRVVLSSLLLLPPTFLMGATLPAMCRVFLRHPGRVGRDLGLLYAMNTLGAALGAFLAGFLILAWLGLDGSVRAAALLNLGLAAAALLLARGGPELLPEAPEDPIGREEPAAAPAGADPRVVLLATTLSGFTALGYEVAWVRALMTVLHTGFTYALSLMLGTFLVGIVLGSLVYARYLARRAGLAAFGRAQVLLGGWALVTVWLLGQGPGLERLAARLGLLGAEYTWASWLAEVALASAAVMLVPTILMGICFPLAARLVTRERRHAGRRVGALYAWNTLGSITGSLLCGFWLVPRFGTLNALVILGLVNLALGAGLAWAARAHPVERLAMTAAVLAVAAAGLAVTPADYFRESLSRWREGKLLYFAEDVVGVVEIYQQPSNAGGFYRRLYVNGTSYASTADYARVYHKLLGHLPALVHRGPARSLVIAFGTGMTAGALAHHPAVERVDAVDLSPAVFAGSVAFAGANGHVTENPKVRLLVEDGRNHLLLDREGYDLITLEPPPPRFAGIASLYSREFYELCRSRLHAGGVLAQWIPMHSHTEEEMRDLVRTFFEVFPDSTMWLPVQRDAILVGSLGPADLDAARIAGRMREPEVAADLADIGYEVPAALFAALVADAPTLRRYVEGAHAVTDDRPSIEFFAGKPLVERPIHLARLLPYRIPVAAVERLLAPDGMVPEAERELERYHRAMGHYYQGAVRGERGDGAGRAREWLRAATIVPESLFFRRLIESLPGVPLPAAGARGAAPLTPRRGAPRIGPVSTALEETR